MSTEKQISEAARKAAINIFSVRHARSVYPDYRNDECKIEDSPFVNFAAEMIQTAIDEATKEKDLQISASMELWKKENERNKHLREEIAKLRGISSTN